MQPDVGAQELAATADAYYYMETTDDYYNLEGAYYYVEAADDQE